MIPMEALALKEYVGNYGKNDERNAFLYYLKLHKRKRTTIIDKSYSVGWNLTAIFEESNSPTKHDYTKQRPV